MVMSEEGYRKRVPKSLVISRSGGFLGWSVVTGSGIGSRSGPARITTHFPYIEGTGSHRLAAGPTEQRYGVL
jgi:hypothetical protein